MTFSDPVLMATAGAARHPTQQTKYNGSIEGLGYELSDIFICQRATKTPKNLLPRNIILVPVTKNVTEIDRKGARGPRGEHLSRRTAAKLTGGDARDALLNIIQ
jgi:hypothetical protein